MENIKFIRKITDYIEYERYVNTNNLSGIIPFLKEYKLAKPLPIVGGRGLCTYPLFLFNMTVLREYAPEEVDAYLTALEGKV